MYVSASGTFKYFLGLYLVVKVETVASCLCIMVVQAGPVHFFQHATNFLAVNEPYLMVFFLYVYKFHVVLYGNAICPPS